LRQAFSPAPLSSAKVERFLLERLSFLGPTRAMVIEFPNARAIRVEAHGLTEREARELNEMFGGKVSEAKWLTQIRSTHAPAHSGAGPVVIVSTQREYEGCRVGTVACCIPAGMAFGRANIAPPPPACGCLPNSLAPSARRVGSSRSRHRQRHPRHRRRKLGAREVLAGDFDPHAVRSQAERAANKARTWP